MNQSRQPICSSAADAVGRSALPGRVALAALIAFSLLALGAIAMPGFARAANGGPKITFASPIYAVQNNGFAEGPVGTNVSVQGSGWVAGGGNVTIQLADEQNDTAGLDGSACQTGPLISIPGISAQPVDGSGNFTAFFEWPDAAGQKGHSYWACGTQGGVTAQGVDKFTVLSSNAPSVAITVSQAAPGSMIAVTGQNWLPGGVKVQLIIAPCVACDIGPGTPTSSTKVTASGGGTFNVLMQVPQNAEIGKPLFVSAQNIDNDNPPNTGALTTGTSTAAKFTVVSDQTPTVTVTTTPTATSTAAATSTTTAGGTGNNNNTGTNSSSGNTLLLVLLAALGAVLLLGAVIAIALYVRSRGPASASDGQRYSGGYGPKGGQYGGPGRARDPYDEDPYGPPSYPNTTSGYYERPAPRSGPPRQGWDNAGGWQDDYPEPGDEMGDDPTVRMPNPWRR